MTGECCTFVWLLASSDPMETERYRCNVVRMTDERGKGLRIIWSDNGSIIGRVIRPESKRLMTAGMFQAVWTLLENGELSSTR